MNERKIQLWLLMLGVTLLLANWISEELTRFLFHVFS